MCFDYINTASRHAVCEERKVSSERADRMKAELENMEIRLEEERKRSAELLLQVTPSFTPMLLVVDLCQYLHISIYL